jgi:hypothetical protein
MLVAFVGMLLAVVIAIPLGGALAGPVRSLLGVPRLLSGLVGAVIVATVFVVAALALAGPVARAILARRPVAIRLNRWLGTGLGALEGMALSLVMSWGLALLQPVARAAQRQVEARGGRHPVAEAINRIAEDSQSSLFGQAASAANPLREAAVVRIATDLAEVAGDEAALHAFSQDPAIRGLADEPEVKSAIQRVKGDKELMRLIEEHDIRALLDHQTIADLATDPALRRQIVRSHEAILEALERAKQGTAADRK